MSILSVTSLFSGAGMQERGLENAGKEIGFDIKVVQTCEMDIYAIQTYAAIHNGLTKEMVDNYDAYPSREEMAEELKVKRIGYDFVKDKEYDWDKKAKSKSKDLETTWLACKLNHNVGDIMKVKELEYCDMLTWSFPCCDLSVAGAQKGLVKSEDGQNGTRSGLVYEVIRLLNVAKEKGTLPKFMIMENVDALVNKKNKPAYELINEELSEIGYNCYYEVMNTKYTGIPQNRARCYAMYVRKDIDQGGFTFPLKFDNGIRLKDILEENVDDKYFIKNEKAQELIDKLVESGKVSA